MMRLKSAATLAIAFGALGMIGCSGNKDAGGTDSAGAVAGSTNSADSAAYGGTAGGTMGTGTTSGTTSSSTASTTPR